jgi:antitoxin VapB
MIHTMISIMSIKRAKVFQTGRSQAVRLPKEFRFDGDTVLVRREGSAVILEPDGWPDGYALSFAGIPDDFARGLQGESEPRETLG